MSFKNRQIEAFGTSFNQISARSWEQQLRMKAKYKFRGIRRDPESLTKPQSYMGKNKESRNSMGFWSSLLEEFGYFE
ncbi:unnamed protein product [Caenorhabditis angaria]|uniref:Uncharacterized protein n=1 Tax=Caenorhabditis angaria TaxID=860376 RepID=A0A9P1MV53_9PELO|nr:unnamed protein product [Caenorhabditis angaria]